MALVGWVLVLDPFHTPPHLRVHLALLVVVVLLQHCLVLALVPRVVFVEFLVVLFSVAFAVVPFVLDLMTLVLLALAASSVVAFVLVAFVLEFEALGQKWAVRKLAQALAHQPAQKRALLCRCAQTFLALNCGLKLVVPKRLRDASLFGLELRCYSLRLLSLHTWAVPLVLLQIFSFFLP